LFKTYTNKLYLKRGIFADEKDLFGKEPKGFMVKVTIPSAEYFHQLNLKKNKEAF